MARLYLRTPTEVAAALGARARATRKAQGLTQAEVAARAGLGRRTVQRFEESGSGTVDVMVRIGFALGVPDTFDALFPSPAPRNLDEVMAREDER